MHNEEMAAWFECKRFGLVACAHLDDVILGAFKQAGASFSILPPAAVDVDDAELGRFDAIVLSVGDEPCESGWLRPNVLRDLTRPLLLAGPPQTIYFRQDLHRIADEVILSPFTGEELLFRLHRITGGKSPRHESAARMGKPVVLVADDDLAIVNYLDCVFKNFNVDVHYVSDGRAALASARRLLPDLLVLDLGLPLMNGMEVLRCLRRDPETRHLITVMLTASSDPADIQSGAELGASNYIVKPFAHHDLVRKLKALITQTPIAEEALLW